MKKTLPIILISVALIIGVLLIVFIPRGKTPANEYTAKIYSSETYHSAIETPSRVLLVQTGGLYYYSKVDGESYRFCFDPLCEHKGVGTRCVSALFGLANDMSASIVYLESNSRFYFARGQKIYSTSFDASDLKLEYELGEEGDISIAHYSINYIRWMRPYKNYVYFLYQNDLNGHEQIYRYNADSGKLEAMTSAEDEWVIGYEIADEYIIYKMVDSENLLRFCIADMDFKDIKHVKNIINPSGIGVSMGLYDGKLFYDKENDGIYSYDPLTDTKTPIYQGEDFDIWNQLMAVREDGIYYVGYEVRSVPGTVYDASLDEWVDATTIYNKVYRMSFDGSIEIVLDLKEASISTLNFIDGGVIAHCNKVYYGVDEEGKALGIGNVFLHFEIDESGKFVNPKPIGDKADDEALVEFFSKFN